MDDSGGFRCLVTLVDCPCAALIGSCREECLEPEQMVGSLDQSHDTGFFQPHLLKEHLTVLIGVHLGDFGFGLG